MSEDLSRKGDGGELGGWERKERTRTTPPFSSFTHLQTLRLFLRLLHIHPLRTNQHHTNDTPNQHTTIMRRLMIIIPKHLHSELLALRQIIPAEQVHSLRIRKSGVKGCESAFGDYKAGLGPADLEFVDCGCGRHSFGGDWKGE